MRRRKKKRISKFRFLCNLTVITIFFVGMVNICGGIYDGIEKHVSKKPAFQRFLFWNSVDGIKYKIEKLGR